MSGAPDPAPAAARDRLGARRWLLVYLAFAAIALVVYRGALTGPFVSDDALYLGADFTAGLTGGTVAAVLDPDGEAAVVTMNYAPVHLLLIAAERTAFGADSRGYHAVNVLLHAGNAVLLAALLIGSGAPAAGALVAGLLFLVHPANAEAVAWVSQLKTLAAFAMGFGALSLMWTRPALAMALFAAAVLTKFVVVTLVAVAAAFMWVRPARAREVRAGGWLLGWIAVGALAAWPQLDAFRYSGSGAMPPYEDLGEQVRTIASIGARYLAMAATGTGLAAWHEPPRATWNDPWWLAAIPLGGVLGARMIATLRRRSEEGVWWVCACAGFAPVSQWVPFFYPMGDRYLYFILPGLVGGTVLWLASLASRVRVPAPVGRAALAAGIALALAFGVRASERARVWTDEARIDADAARQYPDGTTALYLEAADAARGGDTEAAVALLRRAEAIRPLGLVRPMHMDGRLARIHDAPEFEAFMRELARERVETAERLGLDHPVWLRSTAAAHSVLGEYDEAIALLERAMETGGPKPELMMEILEARQARRARDAGEP